MRFDDLGYKNTFLLQVVPKEMLYTLNKYTTSNSHKVCRPYGRDLVWKIGDARSMSLYTLSTPSVCEWEMWKNEPKRGAQVSRENYGDQCG